MLGDAKRIGTGSVTFIDEGDTGYFVPGHLPIYRDGLRLDTADGAEDKDRTIKHPQRPLNLNGKVDVAGSVDDVDIVISPGTVRCC